MDTIAEIARVLKALQAAQRSGSPSRLRLVWKKSPTARTLAGIAERTERQQRQPRQPERHVANVLAELAKRTERK